jgi:hypothetical protein
MVCLTNPISQPSVDMPPISMPFIRDQVTNAMTLVSSTFFTFNYGVLSCHSKVEKDEVGGTCGTNGGEEERV